jgi:hypothetical protein
MRPFIPALLGTLLIAPAAAQAEGDSQPTAAAGAPANQIGCGISSSPLAAPGQVTIDCVGVTEAYGTQLAGILTHVLRNRLDPEIVIAKLDEISGTPAGDEPRNLTADQGQAILKSLVAGPPAVIKIVADPEGSEPGNYALAIATRLGMAGWQIAGSQIPRTVPPGLDDIHGLVLVVRDEKKPPDKAQQLKKALAAAKVFLPVISRAEIAPDEAMLWVGKRPVFNTATQ